MEKEPTLFTIEGEIQEQPQKLTSEDWAEIFKLADDVRKTVQETGVYMVVPSNELLQHVETWFVTYEPTLKTALADSGLPEDLQQVAFSDYVAIFCGTHTKATPQQAEIITNHITTVQAFNMDRLGFFYVQMLGYARLVNNYKEWLNIMRNKETPTEQKVSFLNDLSPLSLSNSDWRAYSYMVRNQLIEPNDFAGIESNITLGFFEWVVKASDIADYVYYYFIAKQCLLATPEELSKITPPQILATAQVCTAVEYAETFCDKAKTLIIEFSKAVTKVIVSETQEQREKAKIQVQTQVNEQATRTAPITLHDKINRIQASPINISPNGQQIVDTKPIQRYIEKFNTEHPNFGIVTPRVVQTVFEGVNLLPQFLKGEAVNGQLTFTFTISKFAEICGKGDANQKEKRELSCGLATLNNLYVIVNKPTKNGRSSGRQAIRVISIRKADVNENGDFTGNIVLDIEPKLLSGKPTLITFEDYQQMRKAEKGLPKARFNKQLLTKGHKAEKELLDECFDYSGRIAEAERIGGPDGAKKEKGNIWKHQSRDKKTVEKWFEEYAKQGLLVYKKTENAKGEIIYSWTMRKPIPVETEPTTKL